MVKKNDENLTKQSEALADRQYDPQDYGKKDNVSKAFAVTHEQVSDNYTEGTIDGVMEDVAGEDVKLQREKFSK